jgi:hypothetical protein
LRGFFARWGVPTRLRLDNGHPWGSPRDLPTELALWLIGLGVEPHWHRPKHCEENGVVERDHGVLARWCEPATCPDGATLARRLAQAATLQRDAYPVTRTGASRSTAYPSLAAGGRPYEPAQEARIWDVRRVWQWLGRRSWRRLVDKVGRISLYNRPLGVGRAWAGQSVVVTFDPRHRQWVIHDAHGTELRRHDAPELSRRRILSLSVAGRRPPLQPGKPSAAARGQPYAA